MKPEWREFLVHKGAEFDDHRVTSFGNPEREVRVVKTGNIFADLSHFGLISIHGEDALKFLQGQFTNDIREVTEQQSQLNAYCNPKGRILANFLILRRADSYYLRIARDAVENTIKRLRMFVLNARVSLEDASESFVHLGCSGPNVSEALASGMENLPLQPWQVRHNDTITLIRLPGPQPRYEILGELDACKKIWTQLDVHSAPVGEPAWSLLDIEAGIPVIGNELAEAFVPQMVNMQLINGVSFKKGCYTGQEVVARMQYLGKLKRRMYHAHIDCDTPPRPGDNLFAPDSTSSQGTGKIVNAQISPDGGYEVLAVVEISSHDKGKVHLGSNKGPQLEFIDLPYDFSD